MDYTVLARRFRPQTFGDVVGQQAIAQALRNALAASRVAHAYLFTGARGVGKTSTARILAKSLNCPQAQGGDPCNQCEICRRISAGSDVDVLEIDGASSRGIDEIRALRANVIVRPMQARHKIYIIDEVHMLTREAFNALLKTLEEPPANVKFIFCTTEPQKVPDTIRSRCQRFDFGTIDAARIRGRLEEIAAAEGVAVEAAALDLIARRAAGSMRDSQSLFDQLLAFGGQSIAADDVHRLLGTASDERVISLAQAIVDRDAARVLDLLDEALAEGVALGELTDQLLGYFRDLMVLAAGAGRAALLSVAEESRPRLLPQAARLGMQTILCALQILAEAKYRMRGSVHGRLLAELALVRLATLEDIDALGDLLLALQAGTSLPAGAPAAALAAPAATGPARTGGLGSPQTGHAERAQPKMVPAGGMARQNGPVAVNQQAAPTATVDLVPGNESLIWAQVVSRIPDMTKNQLKSPSRLSFLAPDQLVVEFAGDYHLLQSRLNREPELVRKLEELASQVAGTRVRLRFEFEAPSNVQTPSPAAPESDRVPERPVEHDPFVQRALELFDASIQRVEPMPPPG